MTLAAADGALRTEGVSARLTAYPTTLLTQALADTSVAMVATPGGPTLAPLDIPDASPLPGAGQVATSSAAPPAVRAARARLRWSRRPSRPRPPPVSRVA